MLLFVMEDEKSIGFHVDPHDFVCKDLAPVVKVDHAKLSYQLAFLLS